MGLLSDSGVSFLMPAQPLRSKGRKRVKLSDQLDWFIFPSIRDCETVGNATQSIPTHATYFHWNIIVKK